MLNERFSDFMKSKMNHIDSNQQNTPDIDGYYYEGADGSQICFWTYFSDRESKENVIKKIMCSENNTAVMTSNGEVFVFGSFIYHLAPQQLENSFIPISSLALVSKKIILFSCANAFPLLKLIFL